ncbi:MAG: hypothetical protein ACLSX5_14970 [Lachnospiraceae bacterium]
MNIWFRLIIDGNAVYEIDEECLKQKEEAGRKQSQSWKNNRSGMGSRRPKAGENKAY